jgi:hypothetical protein
MAFTTNQYVAPSAFMKSPTAKAQDTRPNDVRFLGVGLIFNQVGDWFFRNELRQIDGAFWGI